MSRIYTVRPKILRLAEGEANDQRSVRTLNGYSTTYCLSLTMQDVMKCLASALKAGREQPGELLETRDGCIRAAGILLAAAEQAQRDYESRTDQARDAGKQNG